MPILIKLQRDARVCRYLFTAESLYMFRVSTVPIIRSTKTVTAASATDHNIGTATSFQRGQIGTWPRWREGGQVPTLWHVPETAVTVFSTPDDGCGGHPKHVEWFCSKINICILLHLVGLLLVLNYFHGTMKLKKNQCNFCLDDRPIIGNLEYILSPHHTHTHTHTHTYWSSHTICNTTQLRSPRKS